MGRPAMMVRRFQLLSLAFVTLLLSFGSSGAPRAGERPSPRPRRPRLLARVREGGPEALPPGRTDGDRGRPAGEAVRGLSRDDFACWRTARRWSWPISDRRGRDATGRLSVAVLLDLSYSMGSQ